MLCQQNDFALSKYLRQIQMIFITTVLAAEYGVEALGQHEKAQLMKDQLGRM